MDTRMTVSTILNSLSMIFNLLTFVVLVVVLWHNLRVMKRIKNFMEIYPLQHRHQIKTILQYQVTQKHLKDFEEELLRLQSTVRPDEIAPSLWQSMQDALKVHIAEFKSEMSLFEQERSNSYL